jgi:hypothetical protein
MITSQEAIGIVRKWLNEAITGNMSEAEFEDYFHAGQIEDASWLIGKMQDYNPGAPEPAVQVAVTRQVAQSLSKIRAPYTITLTKGIGVLPTDLFHGPLSVVASGHVNKCGEVIEVHKQIAIDQMNDDEWARRTRSYNNRPTRNNPIWRYVNGTQIQVAPLSIGMVEIAYYKNPPQISVSNNINPVWYDTDTLRILGRVLQQAGLNLTDEMAMQFGLKIEKSKT